MPSKAFALMESIMQAGHDAPPPADRAAERRQQAELAALYRPVAGVRDEPAGALRDGSYLMTPDDARDDVVILYIHGGGFRSGTAGVARAISAHLALGTGARVVLPEYRLAPEDPYPAGLDDCVAAFGYAATLAPRVVVAGESAGANLALAVLLRLAHDGDHRAIAGVLYSGVFDQRADRYATGSWVDHAELDLALKNLDGAMSTDYAGAHPADDPLISPVLADLRGLPPLFVQASNAERLLDDSLDLVARAARAGVHVEMEVWPKMSHAWQIAAGFLPEATEAATRTSAFITRVAEGRIVDGATLLGGPASLEEMLSTQ
ncbi:alpha/beta hydrolase fold domain-containing protein [Yinghuangia seranimata]|uniref:alpha/beta hydrolase fold domain-containing protein n=1 Tax=Yinghuangia seranimata TaxID=408067 RepID=UPI00248AA547|nr:alpha/beta hydrolase fold domain-containing protein [Yinghuangia seranimata]MDI2129388.1 alpha/beta hydrolase fold domain-containing protein [Yinghuangia seranimata]